jgi:serine/threonine protein kinase
LKPDNCVFDSTGTLKIIDFGRAIYKYKSKVICSDSFSMTGDAATQYNCEPYFNDKKPRLEPNFSFDLCRLGCSIFDYFIDNVSSVAAICKKEPLAKLIVEWVTDDQNRNILYKANGEERYPDFKLYKMIARIVHNHLPETQFSHACFEKYIYESLDTYMDVDKLVQEKIV